MVLPQWPPQGVHINQEQRWGKKMKLLAGTRIPEIGFHEFPRGICGAERQKGKLRIHSSATGNPFGSRQMLFWVPLVASYRGG